MSVKESIIQNLNGLSEEDLEQVADFVNRLNQDVEEEFEKNSADPQREALEDILEERDKGPFIEITDTLALKERVMAKALRRVQETAVHG